MFSVEERDRVSDHVLDLARADRRVVAGAIVGSLAGDSGDRWSDIDLTFAAADDASLSEILDDWGRDLAKTFDAVHLIDLPVDPILYRVFLLPRCLQLDVSLTPASRFRATSSRFKLVFGTVDGTSPPVPPSDDILGWALLFARYARVSLERERLAQAEYAVTTFRHHALSLACARRGLDSKFGKGLEQLPAEVRASFEGSLVRSFERDELKRALEVAVAALLHDLAETGTLDPALEARIRELIE